MEDPNSVKINMQMRTDTPIDQLMSRIIEYGLKSKWNWKLEFQCIVRSSTQPLEFLHQYGWRKYSSVAIAHSKWAFRCIERNKNKLKKSTNTVNGYDAWNGEYVEWDHSVVFILFCHVASFRLPAQGACILFFLLQFFVYLFDCESRSASILALVRRDFHATISIYTLSLCATDFDCRTLTWAMYRVCKYTTTINDRREKRILVFVSVRAADIPRRFERVVTSESSHRLECRILYLFFDLTAMKKTHWRRIHWHRLIRRILVAIFAFASQYCLRKWKYFDGFMQYENKSDTFLNVNV